MSSRSERRQEQREAKRKARLRKKKERYLKKPQLRKLKELPEPTAALSVGPLWKRVLLLMRKWAQALVSFRLVVRAEQNPFVFHNGVRLSLLTYACLSIVSGYLGVGIYYFTGGSNYFNPWYLFLIPALSVVAGVLLAWLLRGLLRFRGPKTPQGRDAVVAGVLFQFTAASLPWSFFWLKHFWPQMPHGLFYLSLPGFFYSWVLLIAWFRAHFRTREWFWPALPVAAAYLAALFFVLDLSEVIVRYLRL